MGDAHADGAAEVEAAAAAANALAPDQPRAHGAGEALRQRVSRGDVLGVDDVAHIGCGEQFGARDVAFSFTVYRDDVYSVAAILFTNMTSVEEVLAATQEDVDVDTVAPSIPPARIA